MPTLYKPIKSEPESVWSGAASVAISDQVFENRVNILEKLKFHDHHGRPGKAAGKFDLQIARAENEVLSEIAGVLTLAAAHAA